MIEHYEETAQRTVTVMHMDFTRIPAGIQDDGLLQNPCYPKDLVEDPGFACKLFGMSFLLYKPILTFHSALD